MKRIILAVLLSVSTLGFAESGPFAETVKQRTAPIHREPVEVVRPVNSDLTDNDCVITISWKLTDPYTVAAEYDTDGAPQLFCRWQQTTATKIALDRLLRGE